jgi:hypothetical protein
MVRRSTEKALDASADYFALVLFSRCQLQIVVKVSYFR